MTSITDLLANTPRDEPAGKTPPGWEPGYTYSDESGTGEITSGPLDSEPDEGVWAELIADWGLDPTRHQIIPGSVQVRGWDANIGGGKIKRLRYYRARIENRTHQYADVDELIKLAGRRKPRKQGATVTDHPAFVVSLNDWQLGKKDMEGGTPEALAFITEAWQRVLDRLRELDRLKRRPSSVVLANTGDLVEGVAGHYATQTFTVDLNMREQLRVARRLLFRMVDDLVTLGYPVTVTSVPCNHGEQRVGGKAITTVDDNYSHVIVEGVEEACAVNPDRYDTVKFAYAHDLTMVIDVNGVNVGLTHGHQIRGGGTQAAVAKVGKWWQGQIMGQQPIASADMLLTSHLHHLSISEETGRTIMIAPALDGGSYWFTSATGRSSRRGILTLTVGDTHDRGWSDLHVC